MKITDNITKVPSYSIGPKTLTAETSSCDFKTFSFVEGQRSSYPFKAFFCLMPTFRGFLKEFWFAGLPTQSSELHPFSSHSHHHHHPELSWIILSGGHSGAAWLNSPSEHGDKVPPTLDLKLNKTTAISSFFFSPSLLSLPTLPFGNH